MIASVRSGRMHTLRFAAYTERPHPALRATLSPQAGEGSRSRGPSPGVAGRGWPEGPGEGRNTTMKLVITIFESTQAAAIEAIKALPPDHDMVEVRLDAFGGGDPASFRNVTSK